MQRPMNIWIIENSKPGDWGISCQYLCVKEHNDISYMQTVDKTQKKIYWFLWIKWIISEKWLSCEWQWKLNVIDKV